ncbi:GH35 family beta-galactosidase GalD [Nibrella viscosa]|uniref:GH35 family beta-galactosidase GalD n=1 Tax=Nibrella viscosa TaxID=1084524 RepID=A0ABP8KM53_9BACT
MRKIASTLFLFALLGICHVDVLAQSRPRQERTQTLRQAPPIPRLVSENGKHTLLVDGQPFLILGAQLWNSSGWPGILDKTWPQLRELNCNTLEVPIYWEQIEPQPGQYDFSILDKLILDARRENLRLVLLWFASFKNGQSQYVPAWVKENTQEYPRMLDGTGRPIQVLSTLSEKNRNADARAFAAVMAHIRQMDETHRTVIMMQPENEPGSLGTDRDYSPAATKLFNYQVPAKLVSALKKQPGTWAQVFGPEAAEAFSAYHMASYINYIAEAGKKEYPLPMYVNAWIRENRFGRAGEHPSGGPTSNMLDIYKVAGPSIDLLAVDIYHRNYMQFRDLCEKYGRPDNALFIPETGRGISFARFHFYAIGDYNAIGVAPYGIDPFHADPHDKRDKEKLDNKFAGIAANYRLLRPAIPLITRLQKEGKLKAAAEEDGLGDELMHFGKYDLLLTYGFPSYREGKEMTGRVLVGETGPDEFILIGFDTKFQFRPKLGSGFSSAEFISVEEGTFENGTWKKIRNWNGDEVYHSTLTPEGVILKVKLRGLQSDKLDTKPNFER